MNTRERSHTIMTSKTSVYCGTANFFPAPEYGYRPGVKSLYGRAGFPFALASAIPAITHSRMMSLPFKLREDRKYTGHSSARWGREV